MNIPLMKTMLQILLAAATMVACATAEPGKPDDPKVLHTIEIVGLEEGEPVLIVKKQDEILFKEPAMGWLIDSHWSPQGGFLAINERRGNSGDYLWILDVRNRRVIKRPEDKTWEAMEKKGIAALDAKAREKWGQDAEGDRSWGSAARWENEHTLIANVAVRYLNEKSVKDESPVLYHEIKLHIKPGGITLD